MDDWSREASKMWVMLFAHIINPRMFGELFKVGSHNKSSKFNSHILTQIYNFSVDNDIPADVLRAGCIFLGCCFKPEFP